MIKGRYVALVEVDFHFTEYEYMKPFEDIKDELTGGFVTKELERTLQELFMPEGYATVKATQQYADLYRVEDGDTE